MPSNIEHANISALKLGTVDVTKGYIGHQEVYPNTREIQSAAYTNTSTLSNSGGTRLFRVTGAEGATYNLTGFGAGSYTLASSPYDHSINPGSNNDCGDPSRTILTTLTPLGGTILQGGGSTFASSYTQSAGPAENYYNFNVVLQIYTITSVTTVYNGTLFFTNGSKFRLAYSGNNNSPSSFTMSASLLGSGSYSNISGSLSWNGTVISATVGPGAFSGGFDKTISNIQYPGLSFQRGSFGINNATASNPCDNATGGNNGPAGYYTSNLYP
tara:strand:+ start:183 stop:995 length:813 start_codon:yes stop_codon:yes gene_type:complete